jgi:glycosyltransferase involved in cell wall biosynthesis
MKVIALLAVRNERLYIKRCLEHLEKQNVHVCLINNDSSDDTLSIAKTFLDRNVVQIERVPYRGSFELAGLLKRKEELSRELDADWFIHHDADEIRESPYPGLTLHQALERADKAGSTAVNFDEFVFLPCREDEQGF